ncbi:hypothetical protein [Neotabrizicola sp. VNH66]|uniref:hypothetical protein n=1 Tax=Neotabrizicola sp. VNH66 TaxID=3400918 RepID=UPI003C017E72
MTRPLFRLEVLGEHYVEVRKPDTLLWAGTLMYFPTPPAQDAKCYMMVFDDLLGQMAMINWLGFKAGSRLILGSIPQTAMIPGSYAVPLRWFRDNWHSQFLPFGRFATTRFLVWDRSA